MTEYSRFFASAVPGQPEYNQPEHAEVLKTIYSSGVLKTLLDELEVIELPAPAMSVRVKTGQAWINGFWYGNDDNLDVELDAADEDLPRIDRIVVRLDTLANFKISTEVLTGEPGAIPAATALTETAAIWEIPLAQVLVGAGVVTIVNANITDERVYATIINGADLTSIQTFINKILTTPVIASLYQDAGKTKTVTMPAASDTLIGKATVDTLTNKRIQKRVYETTSLATLTPEISTYDIFNLTAQAEAINIANHSTSTPASGEMIMVDILPDATPRAITYGTNYVAYSGVALPSTTVASKKMQMLFIWLPVGKYSIVWAGQEA